MPQYVVATVDEIPPGERKIVEVAGRTVGIFNLGGEFFALLNRCPHQSGPLCEGRLAGFIESSRPGEYRYTRKGEILRCPWHGWEYDIRTGQSWWDPAQVRVRKYKTVVAPGEALPKEVAPAAPGRVSGSPGQPNASAGPGVTPRAAPEGLQPGPYVAETYPVSVEREYVVVEIRTAAGVSAGA